MAPFINMLSNIRQPINITHGLFNVIKSVHRGWNAIMIGITYNMMNKNTTTITLLNHTKIPQ